MPVVHFETPEHRFWIDFKFDDMTQHVNNLTITQVSDKVATLMHRMRWKLTHRQDLPASIRVVGEYLIQLAEDCLNNRDCAPSNPATLIVLKYGPCILESQAYCPL